VNTILSPHPSRGDKNSKKSKLLRIAEEKEKQEKLENNNRVVIPVQHRLGTIKLPVAAHLDITRDSCHLDEVEQEFINPAPVHVTDEISSPTSRGISQDRSVLSRLGRQEPILYDDLGESKTSMKRRLGVSKESLESRLGSQRSDDQAGHQNAGSSSEFDPLKRTETKKTRRNPRLEPDSRLVSNSDVESDS